MKTDSSDDVNVSADDVDIEENETAPQPVRDFPRGVSADGAVVPDQQHHHSQMVTDVIEAKKRRFAPRAMVRACVSLFAGMFAG